MIMNYLNVLGRVVRDRVTHFEGTVTNITFDLYGCVQGAVQPRVDKDGKFPDGRWLDIHRLEPVADARTAPVPDFADAPTIDILGRWGQDCVTGFEGTISSIAFPLAGQAEIAIAPRVDKDGKHQDGKWFDARRVKLIGDARSMPAPMFQVGPKTQLAAHPSEHGHGPAEKPAPDPAPPI